MIWRHISRAAGSRRRDQAGQTLIEFALAAPLLLVFLLALVDFGIAIDRRIVLDHAVREGARYAAVGGDAFSSGIPTSLSAIEGYTAAQSQGIADAAGATGSDNFIDVCYADANGNLVTGDVGDEVRVKVRYKHDFVTGFTSLFSTTMSSIDINANASARVEQPVADVAQC